MRLYFSRSFAHKDKPVYDTIKAFLLQDVSAQLPGGLEVVDSINPQAGVVFDKIAAQIAMSDACVAIFTRRHQIASPKGAARRFSAPPFVASEAAYAASLGKAVLPFLEGGSIPKRWASLAPGA